MNSGFSSEHFPPAGEQQSRKSRRRFNPLPFSDLKAGDRSEYLIKGILPRSGLIVVWGPPKCGKSFWAFDLTLHIALDREYRSHRVQKGPAVYIALEGQVGFGARADAFRKKHHVDGETITNFYIICTTLDLVKEHKALISAIGEQSETPVAVVLDTLNRSIAGSESSDEDMTAYIRAAGAVQDAFGCAVIIVHHCGVEGTRPRGHTSLTGAADVQISVQRDKSGNVVAKVECAKDIPDGTVIVSRLEVVELGLDQDGDQITSCVIVPTDEAPSATTRRKLTNKQKLAMEALTECVLKCVTQSGIEFRFCLFP
jgi:AAA domain